MAAYMNEADDEQNYDFQAICKLQAHIRGLLVRKKLNRLRDLYQRLAVELDGATVPGVDSNQILWRRPHLCKPVFVTQTRKTTNYAKSSTRSQRHQQQQHRSGRLTHDASTLTDTVATRTLTDITGASTFTDTEAGILKDIAILDSDTVAIGTLTDSTIIASTFTDTGAGILDIAAGDDRDVHQISEESSQSGHSSEDSHSGKASQGEISSVEQNQALTEETAEIDEGKRRHSEKYGSNDILAELSVPSRNDNKKELYDRGKKESDSQSDVTDKDSRCDAEEIDKSQARVFPEVDGHCGRTGDIELGRIVRSQSGDSQINRLGMVESPKEPDIPKGDRGSNRTDVTGGTLSSDNNRTELKITKVVDSRSLDNGSEDDGAKQKNNDAKDHTSVTGSSGRNNDCEQGNEKAEVTASGAAPRTRDNQFDVPEDQVSSEQPCGSMQQSYDTDSSSTNKTKSRDDHSDKDFCENQRSEDRNQHQQGIHVSNTARVPGGLIQQDGKDGAENNQRDLNELADVEAHLDGRESKVNNDIMQGQASSGSCEELNHRRSSSDAIGGGLSRHDIGMYPADELRLSLDRRKTSSRMEETGITDVTSIWSSEHSFQESITPITEYPSDVEELQKLRSSMAMELLWVQQAISSRKNYLRLKKNMNDG